MVENETRTEKKLNTKIILFIPLAIIIVIIFILMQWQPPSNNYGPAPNFSLPGLDGKRISLKDYKGKVVLVNIWATWCPPCVAETPSLERLYKILKDDDFELLAVSIDEAGDRVIAPFIKKYNLSFPVLVDTEGSILNLYGTKAVPESFIVRKDGIIDKKIIGAIDWTDPEMIEYFRNLINT
jgi:peroxiredoxin